MKTALAVMARYPTVGAVKTRLARTLGAGGAAALYRAFLTDLARRFSGGPRALYWLYHPPEHDFAAVVGAGALCLPQQGEGLGERMHQAFERVLRDGCAAMIMIGADVPHVRDEWLDEAEAALARADVVLGPSRDGGYFLVAMRRAHDIFTGVPMSSGQTRAETMALAQRSGLRLHLLPESFDVDDEEDLDRLRAELSDPAMAALLPATFAVLQSHPPSKPAA